jgi:hypothetical protein
MKFLYYCKEDNWTNDAHSEIQTTDRAETSSSDSSEAYLSLLDLKFIDGWSGGGSDGSYSRKEYKITY